MLKKLAATGFAVAVLACGAVGTAQAQGVLPDRAIYFTFSQPVTLPQTTLPAGKYLFRIADSPANRTIVQIFGEDRKLVTMLMTMPAQRNEPANEAEVYFLETASDIPPAIATYWYPGERTGWEFVYPKSQAVKIAASAKRPVLSTKNDAKSTDEMKSADLVRISPTGDETAINSQSNTVASDLSGKKMKGDKATDAVDTKSSATSSTPTRSQTPATSAPAQPYPTTPAPPSSPTPAERTPAATPDRTDLPATAGETPFIALAGALAILAAFAMAQARRRRA